MKLIWRQYYHSDLMEWNEHNTIKQSIEMTKAWHTPSIITSNFSYVPEQSKIFYDVGFTERQIAAAISKAAAKSIDELLAHMTKGIGNLQKENKFFASIKYLI